MTNVYNKYKLVHFNDRTIWKIFVAFCEISRFSKHLHTYLLTF